MFGIVFFFTSVSRCWLQLVTHFSIAGKTIGHMRWKQLSEKRNRKETRMNEVEGGGGLAWENGNTAPWNYINCIHIYNNEWRLREKKSFGSERAELPFRVWRYHLHNEIVIIIPKTRRNIVTRHKIHTKMAIRAI